MEKPYEQKSRNDSSAMACGDFCKYLRSCLKKEMFSLLAYKHTVDASWFSVFPRTENFHSFPNILTVFSNFLLFFLKSNL